MTKWVLKRRNKIQIVLWQRIGRSPIDDIEAKNGTMTSYYCVKLIFIATNC
jgi:hypothetical protein